jgi:hypothetical protein
MRVDYMSWITFASGGGYLMARPYHGVVGEVSRRLTDDGSLYFAWRRLQEPATLRGSPFSSQAEAFAAVQRAHAAHCLSAAGSARRGR